MLALISRQRFLSSPTIDAPDMLWLLLCAGLVFLMQPGFMCLESGLTRSKNSINVAVKNLADFGISVTLFWAVGYGLMFGQGVSSWVGATDFFLSVDQADPKLIAFFVFEVMFCSTATTIVSGAVAERLRFEAYLLIAVLVSGVIYPLFGHWAWNGLGAGSGIGWLDRLGFVDFAGATVVHSTGAWVSLAALMVVGARKGRFSNMGTQKIQGSNVPMAVLGAMLLWFGWLGFNGGSLLAFGPEVPSIIMNTVLSGAAGMVTAGLLSWFQYRHIEVELLINGSLAGLVAITAPCHVVSTPRAFVIGAIGSVIMVVVSQQLARWRVDDAVDAVAVHGGAGAWGTLAVALLGNPDRLNTGLNWPTQVGVQVLGITVCFLWAFGLTWLVLRQIDRLFPLRISPEAEEIGLNVSEHQAKTELYDLFSVMKAQVTTQDLSLRVPVSPFTEVGQIAARYNQVIEALERKTLETLEYLQQVNRVTAAAAAVENDAFQPTSLDPVALRPDELGQLARVFQGMFQQVKIRERNLQTAKEHLAKSKEKLEERVAERTAELAQANAQIQQLNRQLQAENLRMGAELEVTRRLQQMILPTEEELAAVVGLEIAGFMEPASEVGGDYYDVLQHQGGVKIGIGDVTGHGLESGMVMLMAQTAVRTLITHGETDPTRLLNAVNRIIYDNTRRMQSYKNMTIALLDYEAGLLRLSGQHEELIIIRHTGTIEAIDTLDLGFPLGIESDITPFVSQMQVQLNPGDVAVLYTDGIPEAMNLQKQQYGLDRFHQILCQNRHCSAHDIRQAVIEDVKQHIGEYPVFDDLTLLVLKQQPLAT